MFKESEVICSALKCRSSHVADPSVKFFLFPKIVEGDNGESRKRLVGVTRSCIIVWGEKEVLICYKLINSYNFDRRDEWGKIVGGLKKDVSFNVFLCQYHFPANQFKNATRTSLVKKAMPAFPYGPLNPKTKDFCPIGEEHRFKAGVSQ